MTEGEIRMMMDRLLRLRLAMTAATGHCEKRSDEAIYRHTEGLLLRQRRIAMTLSDSHFSVLAVIPARGLLLRYA